MVARYRYVAVCAVVKEPLTYLQIAGFRSDEKWVRTLCMRG